MCSDFTSKDLNGNLIVIEVSLNFVNIDKNKYPCIYFSICIFVYLYIKLFWLHIIFNKPNPCSLDHCFLTIETIVIFSNVYYLVWSRSDRRSVKIRTIDY